MTAPTIRVLWTHNFAPQVANAGNFMHTFAAGIAEFGVQVDLMYLGNLGRAPALWRAWRDVRVRSKTYDLVHAQFGSACALASSAAAVPSILSLRGSDWHRYRGPDRAETRHGLLAHQFSRLSLRAYDQIVTMSERMSTEVRVRAPGLAVATIADPIDTTLFRPHSRKTSRQALFNSSSEAPWILFTTLSANNPIKRVELAREAVRLAAKRIPGLELKVASGLDHRQMPMFIACCDVALCTSTHEGWPNSIKEALACGLPFVSTDVSDLATIAARHPGCRISAADPQAIADQLCAALAGPPGTHLRDEVMPMDVVPISLRLRDLYLSVLARA